MSIRVLGPVQVDGSSPLSPRDRVVLAALAVHCGEAVSAERLADALWGDELPASWPKVVQGCVVRLRRSLGKAVVKTVPGGYRLDLLDDEIDSRVFERLTRRGRTLAASGEARRAAATYSEALSLWRGPALGELEHWSVGRSEAFRLTELRHAAHEALVEAELQVGDDAVPEATALVTAEPLRERRWALLATALYQQDRQAEALGALRQARRTLLDELGIDPSPDLIALERAILNHDPGLTRAPPRSLPDRGVCPYPGLVAYDRENAEGFFGRSDEVARCLQALGRSPVLVVVGPSGCGKSSLIGAGVVPALEREGKPVAVMTPGLDPQSALVSAISDPGHGQALVVDQLEELFTAAHGRAVVAAFLDRLAELAGSGWRVIAIVRADHVSGLAASVAFSRMAERGLHLITPMTRAEMTESIESPAAQAGLRLEAGLVELLLTEVEGEPGALPLLSYALAETWVRREADVLTVDGYRATGGIRSAVSRSAELLYESLDSSQRAAMRSILLRLVTPSREGQPIAIRAPYEVLAGDPDRARVLDLLASARLVTTDEQTVALAHESVVRAWPRLQSWLDEDVAGQRTLRHLALAADDWAATDRPESELYRGGRLDAALDWRRRESPDLTPTEAEFLDASESLANREWEAGQLREREQVRNNRRLRIGLAGTAIGLVLALGAGAIAARQAGVADRAAKEDRVQRLVAQSLALRGTQPDLAALLALQAYRLKPDATTRGALFGTFTAAPGFLGYRPTPVPLTSGQVLRNGRTLLASGVDGVIRELDLPTGQVLKTFMAPSLQPASAVIALSANERTVAEISGEGPAQGGELTTLSTFDVSTGARMTEARLPRGMRAVAVSPDGSYVAVSGDADGRVFIFDSRPGSALPTLPTDGSTAGLAGVRALPPIEASRYNEFRPRAALAFAPDGLLVVGSESGVVRLVEPASAREVERLTGAHSLTSNILARVSSDGASLLTTGTKGVSVWNLGSHRLTWSTQTGDDQCASAALAAMIDRVVCGSLRGAALTLDLGHGQPTGPTFDLHRGDVSAIAVTPDGHTLVELSREQPVLARWRLDGTGAVSTLLHVPAVPRGYNADGSLLLTGPRDGGSSAPPQIVDARSGRLVSRLTGYALAVWTSSPTELVAWDSSSFVSRVDARTQRRQGKLDGTLQLDEGTGHAASSGDLLLAWGDADGAQVWRVWDVRTGKVVSPWENLGEWTAVSIDADGHLLAVEKEGHLAAYDVSGLEPEKVGQAAGVKYAQVSSTGAVAASTTDGSIAFYASPSLHGTVQRIAGAGVIDQFAFSADGQLLVARGVDGSVRLVDMAQHTALGDSIDIQGPPDQNLALSPDGSELALPDPRGILLWDLRPSSWAAAACTFVGRDLTRQEWRTYLAGLGSYHASCPPPAA